MNTLYLAGGLFNAGERLHNLYLEKHLKMHGYKVILPQREAVQFREDGHFNVAGIVADCQRAAINPENVYVGSADGADADSGTCVEYGMAITATGRAVVYRTDFRTDRDLELGINAMLTAAGTIFLYHPCFFTELEYVDIYYSELAQSIHEAIQALPRRV